VFAGVELNPAGFCVGVGVGAVAPAGVATGAAANEAGVGAAEFMPALLAGAATWFDPLCSADITAVTGSVAPPVS